MTVAHYDNGEQVSENWDAVFKSLSAEPRRQLIVSLLGTPSDQSVSLPESAAMPNVPSDPDVLRVELYHTHLPMLEKNGFVTWETDPFVASRGPNFDEVAVVFDALQSTAAGIPDSLVTGCQQLERKRQNCIDRL